MEKQEDKSETYKNEGNALFKANNYIQAVEKYTLALENSTDNKFQAICYSNRAFCQIKLESYGLALEDSSQAIKVCPDYIKGYYRQGSAYLLLSKLDEAKSSFAAANKLTKGKDQDIADKLKAVKKMIVAREFEKAIEKEDAVKELNTDFEELVVSSDYKGPTLTKDEQITPEWVQKLMEWQKDRNILAKKYLMILLIRAKEIMKEEKTLMEVDIPDDIEFTVCGDTHGQYYDLLNIFKINGNPSDSNPYLFNGDFVDRGSFSAEVMITLLAWKVCNPKAMHLTRGNHETKNMNKLYGFEGEIVQKYDQNMFELFSDLFWYLPLVYILNKKVQVNHGGLFTKDGVKLDDLKIINRVREPPEEGLMTDLLWSDPVKTNGRSPSKRGVSIGFGPDVTKKYLEDNGLELLVRSHEMKQEGYEVEADGKLITIFSAPNYCDQMGNKGALIRFKGKDMKPQFTQFEAVEHPKIPPMAYARSFHNMF